MTLAELTVTQLRCIEHAQLEIPPGLALICGDNGSGKTSLLEGIFSARSRQIVPFEKQ